MTRTDYRLALALALSLLLHLAPWLADLARRSPPPVPPPPAPLQAELRAPLPAPVPLLLPKTTPPAAPVKAAPRSAKVLTAPSGRRNWQDEIRQQFRQQHERHEFYPAEAIARGLQGEVLVLLILNESGQVTAARVEQSSGQPILDAAALRAVRALHALPADAPRETLLPVRFRLH